MAEILQKAYQKAIDEQGEIVDNTSQIDSVIGTGPDIIQPPKIEVKEVFSHEGVDAQEGLATEAKVPESKQGTSPVISIAAELNTSKSPVEDPEFTVAVAAQSKSSNKSSDATVLMSVQEANKSSDGSAEVPQCEVSQPLSVDQMVLDLKRKIAVAAESKSSDGTAEGSVEENKSSDATVLMSTEDNKSLDCSAEGSVEENQSSDASAVESVEESKSDGSAEGSVEENQSSDASAVESVEESKSMDGTAEESVEESKSSAGSAARSVKPVIVSLSALSVMSPNAGPKGDEYQSATQYSPNQGPFTEKNRPRTRSTTSPDPKKKPSSVSPVTNESLKHSGRNFDALVGMDSLSKADFHMTLRFHKYTQPYLDHAYDIVHDFRKCDIRVLHAIEPTEGGLSRKTRTRKIVNQTRPRNRSKLEVHPPSQRIHVLTKW